MPGKLITTGERVDYENITRICLQVDEARSADARQLRQKSAAEQKSELGELYNLKRRPPGDDDEAQVPFYALSRDFVEKWQKFIR